MPSILTSTVTERSQTTLPRAVRGVLEARREMVGRHCWTVTDEVMMGHGLRVVAPARVLRSREDHAAAMAELRVLMKEDPPAGSAAGERLELLAVLIQDYESRTFPIRKATPQEIVEFMADHAVEKVGGSVRKPWKR